MTWKKYFRVANLSGSVSPINGSTGNHFTYRNYQSNLPEVYIGHPNRVERYNQYEQMDQDSEVNAALDILSEFSTQINEESGTAFKFVWKEKPTDNELNIIKEQLNQWVSLNELNKRIFKIFRNTIKYGDQIFIRDPETFKLFWVEMSKVVKVIVNESEGKKPEQYIVKELAPNFENLTATALNSSDVSVNHPQVGGPNGAYIQPKTPYSGGSRFSKAQNEQAINAEHIVHLSLTEGLDFSWPFGNSVLENVFKVFKQKELLEDAIIIYRVQRAPERRIFYIDVGNMPSHMAMAFVERVKNEVHQRRIPTQAGGGQNMMDATYNPLCLDLGTVIPLLDGRKLTLAQIIEEFNEGKENWAYSCDPDTGKIVPGVINWAGVTRKNTEVLELTFDNGQTLICTPDHKIPVFGKGFVEAKDITPEDSLIAFNVKNKKISNNGREYQQVWDHERKEWVWTHRMVGDFFRELGKHQEFTYLPENVTSVKNVIHHRNYDRFNNDPRNLTYMNKQDHILYHASMKKDFWENISDDYRKEMIGKISETTKNNWKNMSEEQRQIALWNFHSAREHGIWLRQNDQNTKDQYKEKMRAARKKYFSEHPEALEQAIKNCESRVKIKNQTLNVTFDMLQIVAKYVKDGVKNKNKVIELCDNNKNLLKLVKENNSESLDYKNSQCKIDFTKFGYNKLDHLISKFGYTNWKKFVKEIDNFNHRVVKITKIQNRDTGTITIDGLERWHNYHTFAIDSGIFVKNSTNEDYFFPQTADGRGSKVDTLAGGCLSMDTQVDLLDGRTLTLTELTEEYKLGKKNWTFSTNPETGEIVPGLISWAGVTQQSAKVLKIVLDNGKEIIATPDHKFPILGKESLRADQLKPGDRLIPFNKSNKNLGKYKKKEYTQIYQNNSKKWQFVHRMVADYEPLADLIKNFVFDNELIYDTKHVIHHLDFNRFNNNPENLVMMSWNDHKKLHEFYGFSVEDSKNGAKAAAEKIAEMKKNNPEEYIKWCEVVSDNTKKMWQNFTTEQKNDIKNSIRDGINRFLSELSDENIENRRKNSIDNFKKGSEKIIKLLQTDIEFRNKFTNSQKDGWKKFKNTEQYELRNKKIAEHSKNRMSNRAYRNKIYGNQKVVYDKALIDSVQKLMISNPKINLNQVLSYINSSPDLLNTFLTSNSNTKCANWNKEKMTESQLRNMPKHYGYKNWRHFKKEVELYNHTIVEIVELDEPITVGTLTIDVDEIYHSYHNFALSAGVFTNNSNLGEITDLHFFTNKLFRGLRIPASYLPTGLDDGTSNPNTFSDGRVGTALIQEWRFNQYCIRLQRSVAEKLDQEFKMFMRWRGINIDGGLFELQFNEPQNFASYRQAEVDSARITSFTQLEAYPYLSKRFLLTRFLGLTEEEMSENEMLWTQEQGDAKTSKPDQVGLRGVGISPGGLDMGIEAVDAAALPPEGEAGASGAEMPATPGPISASPTGAGPAL